MSELRDVLQKHGFRFKKQFGQNFISDGNLLSSIVSASGVTKDTTVVEIGCGAGTLTRALAEAAKKVYAFDIDTELQPVLAETLAGLENVEVIFRDFNKINLKEFEEEVDEYLVVANLPYYITSPVIMRLLETDGLFESVTVMIQKEVADRLVAAPATAEYGAITASCAYWADIEKVFNVSPANFIPPPKVTSSVIRMNIYKEPSVACENRENLFRVIRGAFAKRRKTLSNSLSGETNKHTKAEIETILVSLGYRADVRGETLGLADFAKISDALEL